MFEEIWTSHRKMKCLILMTNIFRVFIIISKVLGSKIEIKSEIIYSINLIQIPFTLTISKCLFFLKTNSRLNTDNISSMSSICGMLLTVSENTFNLSIGFFKQIKMHTIMHCKDALTIRVFGACWPDGLKAKSFYFFFKWMNVWLLFTLCKNT